MSQPTPGTACQVGIFFTASAMDVTSAEFLNNIDVPFIKIGSGDVNNLPLLRLVSQYPRPLVVSTGMSDLSWVRTVHATLLESSDQFVLLQCTSSYPTPPDQVNLAVLDTYRRVFPGVMVGYSGHETGVGVSVAAADMGARIIERHFTLDRWQKGSDHRCSLEPRQMALLVKMVRDRTTIGRIRDVLIDNGDGEESDVDEVVVKAVGDGVKKFEESETECMMKLGKTLVAARRMCRGEKIVEANVVAKVAEPRGLDPRRREEWEGRSLREGVEEDQSITSEMIEQPE